jgi:ABC-type glycerol-3-phosphate transport system substrate-binding protein
MMVSCSTVPEKSPTITPEKKPVEQTLVLWTHVFSSFTDGLKNKWIPEFEAAHPGVKVQYTALEYSGSIVSFDSKLLADVSSGGGPDVWAMDSHNFLQVKYIEAGLLAPLDPKIFGYDSVEDIQNDYPKNSMNVFVQKGKIYALFNELTTLCLFYNKSAFDKAGIPYLPEDKPVSWKTIGDISQKLYSPGLNGKPDRMGYQFGFFATYPAAEWHIHDFYPVLRQYGQNDLYINGKPAANTQPVINTLQYFYDFTHKLNAYDPYFVHDWFADFAQGRTAMVTAGPWFTSAIQGSNPDVRFGIAPHPVTNPDDKSTYQDIMYSFGWVINANRDPEKQKLAQEFLAFILGKKGESEQPLWWWKNVGVLQPRKALLESSGYQEVLQSSPWMNCFINTFDTYHVDYYQHSSDEAGAALVRAIDRVVYNKMDPKESAQLLQNELLLIP